ncbi:MAG TPA: hypothetical protein VFK57_15555 [Vicinamibacterales bacterium]|nr:hypothetical protein [Vicinamibacterales bacterium]
MVGRVLTAAVVIGTGALPALGQPRQAPGNQKPDPAAQAQAQAQQQEIQSLVRLADTAMSGAQAPAEFPIQFQNDFLKAQGNRVWVPITLTLDPAKVASGPLTLYLRVVPRGTTTPPAPTAPANPKDRDKDKDKNKPAAAAAGPAYPYEDVSFMDVKAAGPGQPIRIYRGIGVPAGSYDLYIVLHERAAAAPSTASAAAAPAGGKTSVLKQPLDVPNYANGELATSSVILAERVDQLPAPITPDQQSEKPYAFGQTEIVVSPERKFKKSQELIVLLQIYNPMLTPEKKFNLEATYTFYRQDGGTEKRFNSTEPQTFSAETMGAGFDPSGNSSIQAGQGVPLQSFPEGTYRLEIKITDKLSAKTLTQNVNFTVTP